MEKGSPHHPQHNYLTAVMLTHNSELAKIFDEMATIYEFLGAENRYRVMAYRKAAYVVDHLTRDIKDYLPAKNLEKISGIGPSIAAKIKEYLETGNIQAYHKLKKKVPQDFISLLKVKGLGPETLKTLHRELGIETREGLIQALQDGRVESLKGFKQKKVRNILSGLRYKEALEQRILLWEAMQLGTAVMDYFKTLSGVQKIALAGSIRRREETIGDLDLLIQCKDQHRSNILDHLLKWEQVKKVLVMGKKKASIILRTKDRQLDLRLFKAKEWGAGLLYFTGNKEHNIHLRKVAIEKGWKINEYGLFELESGARLAGSTEEEIYEALEMDWVPPEIRMDRGEIHLAEQHKLPALVELKDIRGDMQMHSSWSDGRQSIGELANHVRSSYPYEYVVLTDHSKSSRIARGLNEEQFRAQAAAIKKINQKLGLDFVKTGAEVDILADGSLDLSDDLLQELDWVTAAIHSRFNQDNTNRLIKACHHPAVGAIAHPTGRMLGKRPPYPVDMLQVIRAAAETGTVLEINAQPDRMDLNENWAYEARRKGVKLVINTDSHAPDDFEFMQLGVAIARRAWCNKEDILNTFSWDKIEKFKVEKQQRLSAINS